MSYEPLHHKYRPQRFADLVGQSAIAHTLINAINQKKIAPAYLFTGPRGTGKTSSARILAKSLNCLNSDRPTPNPCGKCEVCRAIATGTALDVIEIDAASNTGVDNIREVIERAQFAPVQCRYKVYVIDECLTGDSLVQTSEGLVYLNDPNLKNKQVLSYNESSKSWEFKKVLRWLDRGVKETLIIKTTNQEIRCTGNHLIRTEQGWIQAKNVKERMKILSPANTLKWMPQQLENGWQTSSNTQFPQWNTNLEEVKSVHLAGYERVYDIEVEDNHNFVANGLLVHNCHMLSTAAFNALLKTLEEPPRNVIFILATTDPQRVLSTIISRCQRFDYRRIPLEEMVAHLRYIAKEEAIDITEDALTLVAQIANGGLRDAESLLDQLSLLPETITVEKIWDLVGAVPEQDLLALLQAIRENNPEQILQKCRNLLDRGREPIIVLQNLAGFYLNLLIAKTAAHRSDLVAVTETTWQKLIQEAKNWEINLILRGQQQLKEGEGQLKHTTQPRLWLEVILLGLLPGSATLEPSLQDNTSVNNHSLPVAKVVQSTSVTEKVVVNRDREDSVNQTKTQSVSLSQEASPTILVSQTPPQESTTAVSVTQENNQVSSQEKSEPLTTNLVEENQVNQAEDSQAIWLKAIQLIQPPTTQALLIQQCYLLKIEASVVAIAISSNSLSKLLQNKVSNIESAFSQVCQRKMKVHFEVNPPTKTEKKKLDSGFKELSTENFQSGSQVEVIDNHPKQTISATVTVSPQLIQTTTIEQPKSEHSNDLASLSPELETDVDDNDLTDNHLIQLETNQNYEQVHLNQTISQHNNFNSDADFQKAIEIFIKNFEGEIAVLSDYDSETEDEAETTMITPEYQSNLPSKLIDQAKVINHPLKDHLKLTGGRPDLSDYEDDDDIPFVRPVSYRSDNERLYDSWEVAANRPGVWLYGSRGLFL